MPPLTSSRAQSYLRYLVQTVAAQYMQVGRHIGFLGLDHAARRRHRANGRVVCTSRHAVVVSVDQSFGACAMCIQKRAVKFQPTAVCAADQLCTVSCMHACMPPTEMPNAYKVQSTVRESSCHACRMCRVGPPCRRLLHPNGEVISSPLKQERL